MEGLLEETNSKVNYSLVKYQELISLSILVLWRAARIPTATVGNMLPLPMSRETRFMNCAAGYVRVAARLVGLGADILAPTNPILKLTGIVTSKGTAK
jgi:hypothetical protein